VTSQQGDRIKEFETEVRKRNGNAVIDWKESNSPESRGVLFAEVEGVTLVVYPNGLSPRDCEQLRERLSLFPPPHPALVTGPTASDRASPGI